MTQLFSIFFFGLGLIIGSFLNVVISRYNTHRTLGGRSMCLSCQKTLSWHELIPLISFLFLRGRCSHCRSKISVQYAIVEFLTGLAFLLLFFRLHSVFVSNTSLFSLLYAYYALAFSLLLVIAVYDMRHKIIPDMLVFLFGLLAFAGMFFLEMGEVRLHVPDLIDFLAGPILAFPFAFIWFVSRGRAMGFGDAKLSLGIGWLLGLSTALSGLLISFWSGAIIGIILILIRKGYGMKSEIPFAPFLVFGSMAAFFFELYLFPFFQ